MQYVIHGIWCRMCVVFHIQMSCVLFHMYTIYGACSVKHIMRYMVHDIWGVYTTFITSITDCVYVYLHTKIELYLGTRMNR